jgi:5-methylcytosine-specific restriction protein A
MEPVDNRNRKPFENAIRYNEELYKTSQWRKLRKEILKEQPVCSKCGADKGLHIHHIVPPRGNIELFYDRYNLITICGDCHRLETAREINNRN